MGITVIGPLPAEIGKVTTYVAACTPEAPETVRFGLTQTSVITLQLSVVQA